MKKTDKHFCENIKKEINHEECYACYLKTGAFSRWDICRRHYIDRTIKFPEGYESNKK